ncbi:MAG: hypothetical protein LBS16_08150, partial [Prevotellaceae bacterium]|nr:hypothetical protein [Prevotellaceae bacterium]
GSTEKCNVSTPPTTEQTTKIFSSTDLPDIFHSTSKKELTSKRFSQKIAGKILPLSFIFNP